MKLLYQVMLPAGALLGIVLIAHAQDYGDHRRPKGPPPHPEMAGDHDRRPEDFDPRRPHHPPPPPPPPVILALDTDHSGDLSAAEIAAAAASLMSLDRDGDGRLSREELRPLPPPPPPEDDEESPEGPPPRCPDLDPGPGPRDPQ